MVQEDLFALYNVLASERGTVLYSGSFPDDHTVRLIDIAERTLSTEERGGKSLQARAAFALIEAYQNIVRHRTEQSEGRALLVLAHGDNATTIITANDVRTAELAGLRASLDLLDGLDANALKRLFLDRLESGSTTARGGAGLGFIEMARRTGQPLAYRTAAVTPELHRFQLMINARGSDVQHGMPWAGALDRLSKATGLLLGIGGTQWHTEVEKRALKLLDDAPGVDATALSRAGLAALQVLHGLRIAESPALLLCRQDAAGCAVDLLVVTEPELNQAAHALIQELNAADPVKRRKAYHDALLRRGGPVEGWRTGLHDLALRAGHLSAVSRAATGADELLLIEARI